jgi:hypothetical protein
MSERLEKVYDEDGKLIYSPCATHRIESEFEHPKGGHPHRKGGGLVLPPPDPYEDVPQDGTSAVPTGRKRRAY